MSTMFRTIALALRPFITDTYDLLAAADAVSDVVERERPIAPVDSRTSYDHAVLVFIAANRSDVQESLRQNRKIEAIKALRAFTNCGLKAAKEAVEDEGAQPALAPWEQELLTPWEPPF